jgi:hypothetical protein
MINVNFEGKREKREKKIKKKVGANTPSHN